MKISSASRHLTIALLLLITLSSSVLFGQVASDFFLPAEGKNLSVYRVPAAKKLKTFEEFKTHIFFQATGDTVLMTTISYDKDSIQNWTKQLFRINAHEILLVNETSNRANKDYFPMKTVLFKMPLGNEKVAWEDPEHSGSVTTTYSAEYSTVTISGKKSKAIKVTTRTFKKESKQQLVGTIDYYVAGIGLYKTTSTDNFVIQKLDEQKETGEFPTLK